MVIGRGPVSGRGSSTSPAASALENGNRPPCRMTSCVIGSYPSVELLERDALAGLQAPELVVVAHQHALVDVVAGVDRRERGGDGDADAGPLLACTAVSRELPTPLR